MFFERPFPSIQRPWNFRVQTERLFGADPDGGISASLRQAARNALAIAVQKVKPIGFADLYPPQADRHICGMLDNRFNFRLNGKSARA